MNYEEQNKILPNHWLSWHHCYQGNSKWKFHDCRIPRTWLFFLKPNLKRKVEATISLLAECSIENIFSNIEKNQRSPNLFEFLKERAQHWKKWLKDKILREKIQLRHCTNNKEIQSWFTFIFRPAHAPLSFFNFYDDKAINRRKLRVSRS